ncbi:MAG: ATP-binding protein [Deltaproteobacteria bacterium]|nr:ATP-binding protein [Deltaproteobacteria bacterium]
MFRRQLDIAEVVNGKSVFLLGPRQTGKSTLIRGAFPSALVIDLLDAGTFTTLSQNPGHLAERVAAAHSRIVVIDEIQKLPQLLDEVHRLMERDKQLRFVLTGSSARKLKRQGTNLLGGRARTLALHPIVSAELDGSDLAPEIMWQRGALPSVLTSKTPALDLRDYVGTYLQQEIAAEGLTRSIGAFSRFLQTVAVCNAQQLVYTSIGSDAGVPARTVKDYVEVLKDTLLGFELESFRLTKSRKAVASSKLYLFDIGVVHALLERESVSTVSTDFGAVFEHFIFMELRAAIDYLDPLQALTYWRSLSQLEVDFIVRRGDRLIAIEAKATKRASKKDFAGLRAFAEDFPKARKLCVCREDVARTTDDGVEVLPYRAFLQQLWSGSCF